jgi:acyl-CoA thioesterase FadM
MFRWFRLLLIYIKAAFREKISVTDKACLSFVVLPQEVDLEYMNNSCFWTVAEMGLMDILFRSGLVKICRQERWVPLVRSQKIVYKRPLKRFDRYQLETKLISWDERWLYFRQTFIRNRLLIANSLVKVVFMSKEGSRVSPQSVLASLGITSASPQVLFIDQSEKVDKNLLETGTL